MRNVTLLVKTIIIVLLNILLFSCTKTTERIPVQNQDFCASIHKKDTLSLSNVLAPFVEKMKSKTGVYVLEDGGSALVTRAWLSEHAEKTIDIQYFIFSTDNVGLIACDYLVRAADRGVKVRILIDDIMVEATGKELLTLDSHKNISVKIYNPGVNLGKNIFKKLFKYTTDFKSANQRMHNKTFIVDSKVTITGGRNMADEYFDYDHAYNFRDRDVLVIGKENFNVQNSFNDFWDNNLSVDVTSLVLETNKLVVDSLIFKRLHEYSCNPANFWPQVRKRIQDLPSAFKKIESSGDFQWVDTVTFVSDMPGKNKVKGLSGGGISTDALIDLIKKAKHSIDIQTPYLITNSYVVELFKTAMKRGVRVRILTNSLASTDNLEAFSGYQKCRKEILLAGVEIFEFRPDAQNRYKIMTGALQEKLNFTPIFGLHAKSMVIDGKTTVIGTFNLDPRSANLNTECVTVVHSEKIAKGVLRGMEVEYKSENAWKTTLKSNPDNKAGKVKNLKTLSRKIIPVSIL